MFGYNPRSYRVRATKEHRESYLVVPPVVDHDFSQFSALPTSDLLPTVEELMVGEQLKMLSYTDYALAVALHSAHATGAEAADSADRVREAIQVGLHAILELARCDKALVGLSFDSDTKAQLRTLPLGHEELFEAKIGEASKQAEERGHHQHGLKVSFKVPQVQKGLQLQLLPLTILSKPPASILLSRVAVGARANQTRARDVGMARLRPASLLSLPTHRLRPRDSLTRT